MRSLAASLIRGRPRLHLVQELKPVEHISCTLVAFPIATFQAKEWQRHYIATRMVTGPRCRQFTSNTRRLADSTVSLSEEDDPSGDATPLSYENYKGKKVADWPLLHSPAHRKHRLRQNDRKVATFDKTKTPIETVRDDPYVTTLRRICQRDRRTGFTTPAASLTDLVNRATHTDDRKALRDGFASALRHSSISPELLLAHYNVIGHFETWTECQEAIYEARDDAHPPASWVYGEHTWPAPILLSALQTVHTNAEARDAIRLLKGKAEHNTLSDVQQIRMLQRLIPRIIEDMRATHLAKDLTNLALDAVSQFMRGVEDDDSTLAYAKWERASVCYDLLETAVKYLRRHRDFYTEPQAWRIITFIKNMRFSTPRTALRLNGVRGTKILLQYFMLRSPEIARNLEDNAAQAQEQRDDDPIARFDSHVDIGRGADPIFTDRSVIAFQLLLQCGSARPKFRPAINIVVRDFLGTICSRGSNEGIEATRNVVESAVKDGTLPDELLESSLYLRFLCAREDPRAAWQLLAHLSKPDASRPLTLLHRAAMYFLLARDQSIEPDQIFAQVEGFYLEDSQQRLPGKTTPLCAIVCKALIDGFLLRRDDVGSTAAIIVWRKMCDRNLSLEHITISRVVQHLHNSGKSNEASATLDRILSHSSTIDARFSDFLYLLRTISAQKEGHDAEVARRYFERPRSTSPKWNGQMLASLLQSALSATENVLRGATMSQYATEQGSSTSIKNWSDGAWWGNSPAATQACQEFRKVLFAQYPELQDETHPFDWRSTSESASPLDLQLSQRWRNWQSWIASRLRRSQGVAALSKLTFASEDKEDKISPRRRHVRSQAATRNFVRFSPALFHRYLLLLPFATSDFKSSGAVSNSTSGYASLRPYFEVLAWMRALGVRPQRETLYTLCMHLDAASPLLSFRNRDADRNSATGLLRAYLVDWLGASFLPTQEEIGQFIRQRQRKNASDPSRVPI